MPFNRTYERIKESDWNEIPFDYLDHTDLLDQRTSSEQGLYKYGAAAIAGQG